MSFHEPERRHEQHSRKLAENLASTLRVAKERHIVWTEVPMGSGRADVFAIRPSWGTRDWRVYEVKASRGDFWNDVNAGKYEKYLPWCRRFYFACPSGLVKKAEVPEVAGLITRNENGWRTVKPAPVREIEQPSFDFMVGLLDRTFFRDARATHRLQEEVYWKDEAGDVQGRAYRAGQRISELVRIGERVMAGEITSTPEEATELANFRYFFEHVRDMCEAAGVESRYKFGKEALSESDLGSLAEFTARMLIEAHRLQQVGRWLEHLPARAIDEIDRIVAP